jgi:trans-feruloyl-CoA hydratase/vanillin synthase
MYYTLTGETFTGRRAAELRVVNEAVPLDQLRARVRALADTLLDKNPKTLKAAKDSIKRVAELTVEAAQDYLVVRQESLHFLDKTHGAKEGIRQFIDDKSYRPGLEAYKKDV